MDIAIRFNSRCSAPVPLNTAQCSVATGCGGYSHKRCTHCKAITTYDPCLIFVEHWPNSVYVEGSTALLFVFFVSWCTCENTNEVPFSLTYCSPSLPPSPHLNLLLTENSVVNVPTRHLICSGLLCSYTPACSQLQEGGRMCYEIYYSICV